MYEPISDPPLPIATIIMARIGAQAGLLIGLFCLFALLVLAGYLRADVAIFSLLLVAGGVLALPTSKVAADGASAAPTPSHTPAMPDDGALAVVDALVDPGMLLDRRGMVVHANAAAKRQYPAIDPGKPITFFLRNPELVQALDVAARTGETRSVELHEIIPSETWDKVVVSPIRHAGRDWVTDEDRRLILTVQSLTELKRVDALRTDFIANASHELRTPLASLLGFIDTLLGPAAKDAAAREKFLGIMRGQAERMSKLIDDLLSLSRIEMHQHVRPTDSIDLAGLLREVREGLQTQAKSADVEIRLSLPEGPAVTLGDRGQLYEVFENLLDNAIKYGADGKQVEVTLAPANRTGLTHLVSVVDHGPGVEPQHVPRLTERFYRIDADASRRKKGTGLGLAIVKHIVHRHRGQLSIKSAPGQGMRVDVYLP